jgi:hypothetical protein
MTTVETTTFMAMTVRKPSVLVPVSVGSWILPNTPRRSAATVPAANAVSGTALHRRRGAPETALVPAHAEEVARWVEEIGETAPGSWRVTEVA